MTTRPVWQLVAAFFTALVFGLGLGLSGMTNPANVIGFLDVTGDWNPRLAIVMASAVLSYAVFFRLIERRQAPVLAAQFQIPPRGKLDRALVVGSLLFGIGWGLGGYCPGPALMATMTGASSALTFFVSMLAGIGIFKLTAILKTRRL